MIISAEPSPIGVAIAALIAAVRPVDPETGWTREADMGEILCHVVGVEIQGFTAGGAS